MAMSNVEVFGMTVEAEQMYYAEESPQASS